LTVGVVPLLEGDPDAGLPLGGRRLGGQQIADTGDSLGDVCGSRSKPFK